MARPILSAAGRGLLPLVLTLAGCSAVQAPGDVRFSGGFLYAPTSPSEAAAYLVIDNPGPADTILTIESPVAQAVSIHRQEPSGGMVRMTPIGTLILPTGRTRLSPGGMHLMLTDLTRPVTAGDSVDLTLQLASRGTRSVRVPVIDYGTTPPSPNGPGR